MPDNEVPVDPAELEAWSHALRDEIAGHRSTIERASEDLARSEERLNLVSRLLELNQPRAREAPSIDVQQEEPLVTPTDSGTQQVATFEDEIESILKSAEEPLHISKIRNGLLERGVPIPGRGEDANVIVKITADDRFCRTARGTYALKSWGLPELARSKRRAKPRNGGSK